MDQRKKTAQTPVNVHDLTHQIELLQYELRSLKNTLEIERTVRQHLEQNLTEKEQQWQLQNQHNPVGIFLWEEGTKGYFLKEYNPSAQSLLNPPNLPLKLGQSPQSIFENQPEIITAIKQSFQQKNIIEASVNETSLYTFKCVFSPPQQVILYYQILNSCYLIEQKLQDQIAQESIISLFGKKALEMLEISALMTEGVNLITQTLKVEFCSILELLPNETTFFLKAGAGWKTGLVGQAFLSADPNSEAGTVLQQQKPVIIEDLLVEPRFKANPLLHNHHIISSVSVLISYRDQPYGVLQIHSRHKRQFTQEDVNFLQAIANILAIAIDRYKQREQLNLLERAINASSNSIFMVDALCEDHPITYINSGFEKLTGYSRNMILNHSYTLLNQDEADAPIIEEIQQAMREGKEYSTSIRTYRLDGTVFWNEFYLSPIHNLQGHLTHFICVQTDITDRKVIEESFSMNQFCFDKAKDAVFWLHSNGIILYANDAAYDLLGYDKEKKELSIVKSSTIGNFYPQKSDLENLIQKDSFTFETHHRCKDGSLIPVEISVNSFEFNDQEYNCAFVRDITERKKTEFALKDSEERLDSILSSLEDIVWSINPHTFEYIYINPAIEQIYGYRVEQFLQNPKLWFNVIHPEDKVSVEIASSELIEQGINKDIEYRIIRSDGQVRWIRDRARIIYDQAGEGIRVDGIAVDITDRKKAEDELKKSEEQFRRIFELAPIGMAITTLNGKYEKVNQALCQALNYSEAELLRDHLTDIDITYPADISVDFALNNRLLRGEISHFQREKRYLAKDGRIVNVLLQVVLVQDLEGKPLHVVRQIVDITQRKQFEERLLYTASHDSLTNLPNRMMFLNRLQQALLKKKEEPDYLFAVLFLDLDRFKMVNDSMGHTIGDQLLIAISQKLQDCVGVHDIVARFGGDEFTILLQDIKSPTEASAIAEKIQQNLKNPFVIEGYEIFTSSSIGIALAAPYYDKPEEMLRDADLTMYHAKENGRSHHEIFDQAMYQQLRQRLSLETELRKAIKKQEFSLNYQPILDLNTRQLKGFEALIRWISPELGFISPAQFIPIAEETGLIVQIGEWVLEEACRQMEQWKYLYPQYAHLTIAVNLSGRQIKEPHLIEQIDQILLKTKFDPHCLKLEITESILMENMEETAQFFQQLKSRNIKLSMDDFGTGYSSLSYLHRFPMNTLKIDRAFVSRIEDESQEHLEIIRAIISLAHVFNMDVVAEGIEEENQAQQLQKLGCEYGQGYFFSKPLSPQDIETKYFLSMNN
jgi:diguanylate cyclase (GGDEF)-like protein/PAS domain S-box-containing protein